MKLTLIILACFSLLSCTLNSNKNVNKDIDESETDLNISIAKNDSLTEIIFKTGKGNEVKVVGYNDKVDYEVNPFNSSTNFRQPEIWINNQQKKVLDNSYELDTTKSKLITFDNNRSYLCLYQYAPIGADKLLILTIGSNSIIEENAITTNGQFNDLDADGLIEVGGFKYFDSPCRDCDSVYYQFANYWEFGLELKFDTTLSINKTIEMFGVYLGERNDTILKKINNGG